MTESEPSKRRGRPRIPEGERKRHTLTFRMRSDLREAVEELAEANGRTLSEQVEYYVDAAVFSEAGLIYKYSKNKMSPTLFRCISSRIDNQECVDNVTVNVEFPSGHREMMNVASKNYQTCSPSPAFRPQTEEVNTKGDAVAIARAMLAATRKGAIEALVSTLGANVVGIVLAEEAQARQNGQSVLSHDEIEIALKTTMDELKKFTSSLGASELGKSPNLDESIEDSELHNDRVAKKSL